MDLPLDGCSPPRGSGDSNNARPDRGLITLPEVQAASTDNAYELVRTLHPMWLRKRGSNSIHYDGDIVVYMNTTRVGGPDALRQIETIGITSIRYYDPGRRPTSSEAVTTTGAIQVSTQLAIERPID